MKPGMTMSPVASMTFAPSAVTFGPTAAILPSSIRMLARGNSPMSGSIERTMASLISVRSLIAASSVLLRRSRVLARRAGRPLPCGRSARSSSASDGGGPRGARDGGEVAVAAALRGGRLDRVRGSCGLRHVHADGLGERRDEPQVLGREVERERDRGRLRLEERGPLVADERRAGGARGQDVVGGGPSMPAASARLSPSATAWLSPKISGVDGELHRRAGAQRPEVEDGRRQRLEDGPRPLEVRGRARRP